MAGTSAEGQCVPSGESGPALRPLGVRPRDLPVVPTPGCPSQPKPAWCRLLSSAFWAALGRGAMRGCWQQPPSQNQVTVTGWEEDSLRAWLPAFKLEAERGRG